MMEDRGTLRKVFFRGPIFQMLFRMPYYPGRRDAAIPHKE